MAFSVQMPALGESVSEGTVTRWLKKEGDTVEVDEPLLEVSTDKVDTEIPSPAAGTLSKIVAGEDETVEIGGELALIDDGSGDSGAKADSGSGDDSAAEPQKKAADEKTSEAPKTEKKAEPKKSSGSDASGSDVTMPELGESVTEGTVTRWLKAVGDSVEVDEPLLEVSTDKVDTEIPSPVAGTLLEIVADEDETVEVGATLAVIGDGSADSSDDSSSDDAQDEVNAPDPAEVEPETSSDETGDIEGKTESEKSEAPKAEKKAEPKKSSGSDASGSDVTMPELGESVTEGTVTRWLKAVGDSVEVDEPLLEVSTDKVDTEIPSPVAGTLLKIVADEDETVEVGATLAVIGDGSADTSDSAATDSDGVPSEAAIEASEAKGQADTEADAPKDSDTKGSDAKRSGTTSDKGSESTRASGESSVTSDAGDEAAGDDDPATTSTHDEPADAGNAEATPGTDGVTSSPAPAAPAAAAKAGTTPYVTPLVRKLAEEHGVDLSSVEGSGIGGRIRKQDVLAAAEGGTKAGSASPATGSASSGETATGGPSTKGVRPELAELRGTTQKANRIRKITAKKTLESLQTSAQLTQVFEVDMTRVAQLRTQVKDEFRSAHDVKLTFLPFYAKAVVEALVSHPNVNASYDQESNEITYHSSVHLGIAVDTEAGLLSPVIHDAQDMDIPALSKAIIDLAERARASKLTPDDLQGGTFTITNIGSEGALFDTPILVPPQAAMLGTGAIVRRPVVDADEEGESIAIRSMGYLPLTYDHRLIDGADAGRFLTTVKDRLETGDFTGDLGL